MLFAPTDRPFERGGAYLADPKEVALERGVGAPQPREAVGEHAAREEPAELLLDEAGQAVSVAAVEGFPQEGLQMFANDGVEDRVLGVARLIRAMGMRRDKVSSDVPKQIADAFAEAVTALTAHCPRAAAVMARREERQHERPPDAVAADLLQHRRAKM